MCQKYSILSVAKDADSVDEKNRHPIEFGKKLDTEILGDKNDRYGVGSLTKVDNVIVSIIRQMLRLRPRKRLQMFRYNKGVS